MPPGFDDVHFEASDSDPKFQIHGGVVSDASGVESTIRRQTPGQKAGLAANVPASARGAAATSAGKARTSSEQSSDDGQLLEGDAEGDGEGETDCRAQREAGTGNKPDKNNSPHEASADKACGKPYVLWAVNFLQRACTHRGIPRMSQKRNKTILSSASKSHDEQMKRQSPFFDDLQATVEGKARKIRTPEGIPDGAVLALRSAIPLAGVTRGEGKTFKYDCKEYVLDDVFDAMEAEDGEHGSSSGGTGGGSSSDGGRDKGGGGGGAERKRIHDIMRVAGILVEDDVRPLVIESKLQATRAQLDARRIGAKAAVWPPVCERYRDADHEVLRITGDEYVQHLKPNIIAQPNITPEKLKSTWEAAVSKADEPYHNWKSVSGTHEPDHSKFCQGSTKTFVIIVAMEAYPELKEVWSKLLPSGVQREYNGTGAGSQGEEGGKTAADRRAEAKREGENRVADTRKGKKTKSNMMNAALNEVVERVGPLLRAPPPPQQQDSEWSRKIEEHDSKSAEMSSQRAKLALNSDILQRHEEFADKLENERGKPGGGDAARVKFLMKNVAELEKQMDP